MFWPYIKANMPHTRMFFCDPFGHTQPENLFNFGDSASDRNFIYFHDQEPVYPDIHHMLLWSAHARNLDLNHKQGPTNAIMVTSEAHSDSITQVCSRYQWRPYYYFFHGWAALDWFRGYHRTFVMLEPQHRNPSRVFFNANRIIGGRRDHRVLLMYHLLKSNCDRAHYSLPAECPETHQSLHEVAAKFQSRYPDILDVFGQHDLPLNLPGESGHPMHSYMLSQFDAAADSEIYVVTETVAQGRRLHLTEKVFKPMCLRMPFVLTSTAGSLRYLRSYGFRTFHDFWDESYDDELDDILRLEKIGQLLKHLHDMPAGQRRALIHSTREVVEHNFNHFYGGAFESVLWSELTDMLSRMRMDLA